MNIIIKVNKPKRRYELYLNGEMLGHSPFGFLTGLITHVRRVYKCHAEFEVK